MKYDNAIQTQGVSGVGAAIGRTLGTTMTG